MATKCRASAALPAGSPELQSKHPALSKAHSSFIASSPLLCSSQSHLLHGAPEQKWVLCASCSQAPAAAKSHPQHGQLEKKNAVGSLWSAHKGPGRSSASLGTSAHLGGRRRAAEVSGGKGLKCAQVEPSVYLWKR